MGYKMKGFSGFKSSPTKETGDAGLIKAQKELDAIEHQYRSPGWTRAATSVLVGHDPTGGAKHKGNTKDYKKGESGGYATMAQKETAQISKGIDNVKGVWEKLKNFKGTKQPPVNRSQDTDMELTE